MKFLPGILGGFVAGAGITIFVLLLFFPPAEKETGDRIGVPTPASKAKSPGEFASPQGSGRTENLRDSSTIDAGEQTPEPAPLDAKGHASFPIEKGSGLSFLQGRVVFGEAKAPLPGVFILFSKDGRMVSECLTNGRGRFSVGLPGGGVWAVMALPFGDDAFRLREEVKLDEGRIESLEIVVPDRGKFEVTGRVTGEKGENLHGVTVEIWGYGGAEIERSETSTGQDGVYRFPDLEVRFPRPQELTPNSIEERRSWQGLTRGPKWSELPRLALSFEHPEYAEKRKGLDFESPNGTIRYDARLRRAGKVSGTVEGPGGESFNGKYLLYRIEKGDKKSGGRAKIHGKRFKIEIGEDPHGRGLLTEGRLILGGSLGRFWVDDMDLGRVDRTTRMEGVVVTPRSGDVRFIALLDSKGNPVPGGPDIWAFIKFKDGRAQRLEVEDGRLVVPVFFRASGVLWARGIDFARQELEVSTGDLPESLTVDPLPLLMTGKIRFPPGFKEWDEVSIEYFVKTPDRSCCSKQEGLHFDRETGDFRVKRLGEYKGGPDQTYKVTITLPGYKPWVKGNIRLKEEETLKDVLVTFEK